MARQIAALDRQIEQAAQLRARLAQLHGQLLGGAEPELADWLNTLELMTMYDKYFSQDELDRLPMYRSSQSGSPDADWLALIAEVRARRWTPASRPRRGGRASWRRAG